MLRMGVRELRFHAHRNLNAALPRLRHAVNPAPSAGLTPALRPVIRSCAQTAPPDPSIAA